MVDNIEISQLTVVENGSGLMFTEKEREDKVYIDGETHTYTHIHTHSHTLVSGLST